MQCPTCDNVNLAMADRHGIEIDYCPQCRGIWLDRGELDRLIERAETAAAPAMPGPPPACRDAPARHAHHHGDRHHGYPPDYRKKRPKSLLGELFDF
ncbi:zf-TFIIB domain-containing protein [Luteimonas mephitis]|jgi:Zn-finger nucleic acid-binding protein|uniref:TFIIB-type zinc ribbon-containing protein n=1 Tax=Luteimonas mephitis TaxID=83615 RepID=UPI003A9306FE